MGARAASELLRQLLSEDPRYRKVWERHSVRSGPQVSEAAVCRALASHLWDAGERPESDHTLPRRLRDLVSRALSGRVLTRRTVMWFVEAFAMRAADRDQLLRLLNAAEDSHIAVNRAFRPEHHNTMGHESAYPAMESTVAMPGLRRHDSRSISVVMQVPPEAASSLHGHANVVLLVGVKRFCGTIVLPDNQMGQPSVTETCPAAG